MEPATGRSLMGVSRSVGEAESVVGLSLSAPSLPAEAMTASPLPCAKAMERDAASRPAACSGSVGLQYIHGSIE